MVETVAGERLTSEIEQLIALASRVINEHTNDHDLWSDDPTSCVASQYCVVPSSRP